MIDPVWFYNALRERGIDFFAGVPDSLLKHFCACISDRCKRGHVIAANEGNAVAMAAGYHLATGRVGVVYMQNSGLGNAVNPLASLTDPDVYRIPVLMIVGWRGEPGVKDEPQHVKQGRISPGLLGLMEIPCRVMDAGCSGADVLDAVLGRIREHGSPGAILVRKGTFSAYPGEGGGRGGLSGLSRETALEVVLALAGDDPVVSTTGKTSREVCEIRETRGESQRDFLTVGSMGHTSSIALGAAMGRPDRRIVCLDGDGSALMHLGALPVIGDAAPENLVYVLLNNGAHESVGGQRTVADRFDFGAFAKACGFARYRAADTVDGLKTAWADIGSAPGPNMIEVRIRTGSRDDLGRPKSTPEENKRAFMEKVFGIPC